MSQSTSTRKEIKEMLEPMSGWFGKDVPYGIIKEEMYTKNHLDSPDLPSFGINDFGRKALMLGFTIFKSVRGHSLVLKATDEMDLSDSAINAFLVENELSLIPTGTTPGNCLGDMESGIDFSYPACTNESSLPEKSKIPLDIWPAFHYGFVVYRTNSGQLLLHLPSGIETNEEVMFFIDYIRSKTTHLENDPK